MVAAGMIGLLCGDSGAAADYETQTNKPVKNTIAASLAAGPDYKVNDPIVADGYMYRFRVTSTYGPFQATGMGALQKLEHEIWAIGQLGAHGHESGQVVQQHPRHRATLPHSKHQRGEAQADARVRRRG